MSIISQILILAGTFVAVFIPAVSVATYLKMKGWFEASLIWTIAVTLIVAGIIL